MRHFRNDVTQFGNQTRAGPSLLLSHIILYILAKTIRNNTSVYEF